MLIQADARQIPLVDGCVQCVVTSPPYWGLRDYGTATWIGGDPNCSHAEQKGGRNPETSSKQLTNAGTCLTQFRAVCAVCAAERSDAQIGLELEPDAYVDTLVAVFREVRRVLADDGVLWLNLGDSYSQSGRGGNPADSPHRKQATNHGSISVGRGSQLNAGFHEVARQAGAVSRAWSGKAPEGLKPKDLVGIPWRVAFALQADGWYLRSDVIWHKPNPMPESVTDRPTKAHEYLFLLTKSERYFYDAKAIAEPVSDAMLQQVDEGYEGLGLKDYESAGVQNPSSVKARIIANARKNEQSGDRRKVGFNDRWDASEKEYAEAKRGQCFDNTGNLGMDARWSKERRAETLTRNKRTVWTIPTMPYAGAHFATMPEALVEPCILAGSRYGDLIFDPFSGSGTVLAVAERLGRLGVGTDLNPAYHALAKDRTAQRGLRFTPESA